MVVAELVETIIKILVVIIALLTGFAYATWFERRVVASFQSRVGPNRVGPEGLLQPLADGVKLIFKEDIIPNEVDRMLYLLAPALALITALAAFAVVPVGPEFTLFGQTVELYLADINVGLLYFLGVTSIGVYGIVLAGWASNNKYSLLGGLRASAQMISYELAMGLAIVSVVMLTGSLSLVDTVNAQASVWFVVLQPIAFLIFVVAMVAETKRAPFDLPEAEQELVAGFHTEYSGMKFALFFMAEYISIITISGVAVTLFLGGWRLPFINVAQLPGAPLIAVLVFFIKVVAFMFLFVWLRATLPRIRYDKLMRLGWKVMLPLALANVVVTAVAVVARDTNLFGLIG